MIGAELAYEFSFIGQIMSLESFVCDKVAFLGKGSKIVEQFTSDYF